MPELKPKTNKREIEPSPEPEEETVKKEPESELGEEEALTFHHHTQC